MLTNKKRAGIDTFVCAVSLCLAETSRASIKDHESPLPITTFGIVTYGFVGQSFSKQLYGTANVTNHIGVYALFYINILLFRPKLNILTFCRF